MKRHAGWIGCVVLSLLAARLDAAAPLRREEIRQNFLASCFLNEHEGWVVGELGRILHTADGARTFERVDAGTKNAFTGIACFPDKTLIVVGPYGSILRSKDGGAKWEKVDSGTASNILNLAFATPQVGVAVGDRGTILRTEDGGATWSTVNVPEEIPLPEEVAETIIPGDILLYDVDFAGPQHGWIVGEFGVILTTSDAGATWTAQKSPVDTTLFGVEFADEKRGWAVGMESVLLRTVDGGATWTREQVPVIRGYPLALYDVDVKGQYGWAVGDSGYLLRSTDGGATWSRVDMPIALASNWFRGVSLTPPGVGFLVGGEGLILATEKDKIRPE